MLWRRITGVTFPEWSSALAPPGRSISFERFWKTDLLVTWSEGSRSTQNGRHFWLRTFQSQKNVPWPKKCMKWSRDALTNNGWDLVSINLQHGRVNRGNFVLFSEIPSRRIGQISSVRTPFRDADVALKLKDVTSWQVSSTTCVLSFVECS